MFVSDVLQTSVCNPTSFYPTKRSHDIEIRQFYFFSTLMSTVFIFDRLMYETTMELQIILDIYFKNARHWLFGPTKQAGSKHLSSSRVKWSVSAQGAHGSL